MKWFKRRKCKYCEDLQRQLDRERYTLSIWKEMYINQYKAVRGHMKGIERLRRKIAKLENPE